MINLIKVYARMLICKHLYDFSFYASPEGKTIIVLECIKCAHALVYPIRKSESMKWSD